MTDKSQKVAVSTVIKEFNAFSISFCLLLNALFHQSINGEHSCGKLEGLWFTVSDGFNYDGKRGYCLQLSTLFLQERLTTHWRVGTACSLSAPHPPQLLAKQTRVNCCQLGLTLASAELLNLRGIVNQSSQAGFENSANWQLPWMFTNIFWASVLNT